jgi:hypothetical protein
VVRAAVLNVRTQDHTTTYNLKPGLNGCSGPAHPTTYADKFIMAADAMPMVAKMANNVQIKAERNRRGDSRMSTDRSSHAR